jgi:putative transposase
MARNPRVTFPDVALHVIQRGNDSRNCFQEAADHLVFLSMLRQLCGRWQCALHAYCLMTNHVHLLLTPCESDSCGMLMRDLGRSYVRYFNDRYDRSGTLWEGRYRSCLVDSPAYVLACHRYVELNPVRAAMVRAPADYPWSSHRTNIGLSRDDAIAPHAEYLALGVDDRARRLNYRALFEQADDSTLIAAIRSSTNGGYPLVGQSLKLQLGQDGARLAPGKPGRRQRVADECARAVSGQLSLNGEM